MAVNFEDLKAACFEVARSNMWERRPIPASSIQKQSDEFFHIASEQAKIYHEIGVDTEIINRAVWYLAQVHASPHPTMVKDSSWFEYMLEALLELALPNTLVEEGRPKEFLDDLIKGINESIENTFEPGET